MTQLVQTVFGRFDNALNLLGDLVQLPRLERGTSRSTIRQVSCKTNNGLHSPSELTVTRGQSAPSYPNDVAGLFLPGIATNWPRGSHSRTRRAAFFLCQRAVPTCAACCRTGRARFVGEALHLFRDPGERADIPQGGEPGRDAGASGSTLPASHQPIHQEERLMHYVMVLLIAAIIFAKAAGYIAIPWFAVIGACVILAIPLIFTLIVARKINNTFNKFDRF